MKILLIGQHSKDIEDLVRSFNLEIADSNPDVIISYGGDGTFLSSEREYPGIPKLPIRDSLYCKKCDSHDDKTLLQALAEGKLELKEYKKLTTEIEGRTLLAMNDFVIRNAQTIHAIRFKITLPMSFPRRRESIQNKLLIGDGIVVATPFGSTGYFKSITDKSFTEGFAIAFNNLTEKKEPVYLNNNDTAGFKLTRGKAILTVDNNPEVFHIPEDLPLSFRISDQVAKVYMLETLRCSICQVQR